MEKSLFQKVLTFLNTQENITRQELIKVCGEDNIKVIDTYRSYFSRAGFLVPNGRGRYTRLSHIPSNLTIAKLREIWENK